MRRLVLALSLCTAVSTFASPPGRLVDMGGRSLHLDCRGTGAPTIVLEAGAAEGWYSWYPIHDALAREFRTCAYDRAGFGFSDARPGPRTVAGLLADLHELLQRAGEKPPFVLVGHSLGGSLVLKYYVAHPEDVAGLVLVDSPHPDRSVERPAPMQKLIDELNEKRPKQLAEWRQTGNWPEMWAPDVLPRDLRKTVLRLSASQKWWEARYAEGRMSDGGDPIPAEKRRIDVPLAVIAANRWDKPEGWSDETLAKYMRDRQELHADLASRAEGAELILMETGHHVHHEQPQVVIDAVRRVARADRAARAPGMLVDVGGRRLHLYCTGSGAPTVILEAGASSGFYSFWEMQPRIPFRACSYDRAGLGFSDGRPGRRVSSDIAQDLHELLRRAGERPPYVLVGHSLGGLFVRKFAELYPRDVAGMVLLDSAHEDAERLRPPEVAAAWQPMRERIQAERAKTIEKGRRTGVWPGGPLPAFLPNTLEERITRQLKSEKWWQARHSEAEIYEREPDVPAERRRLDMPLVVFTATRLVKFDTFSDEAHAKFVEHHIAMDAELASRSPRGEHIVLDVNHGVHWDAPDAVIDAIRRVARPPQE